MRAISTLKREAGMSTSSRSELIPLRIRVRKSAIGSVIDIARLPLPARLGEAGDVALVGHLAQADTAQAELAEVRARPAAAAAAVVLAGLVLLRPLLPHHLGSLRHLAPVLGRFSGRSALGLPRGRVALLGARRGLVSLRVLLLERLERG